MNLKTSKYDLYEYGGGYYRVIVYDKKLANRVNKLLAQYENYKFQNGDEPVFKFAEKEMTLVLKALQVGQ